MILSLEKVKCGHCCSSFGRKIWNSNDERLRRVVWRCNRKYAVKGKKSCDNKHIDDSVLYKTFVNAFNAMIENRDYFMEKWNEEVESENALVRYKEKQFIKIIENVEPIKEFDMDLFFRIVEKIIVTLLDGTEVECLIK